PASTVRAPARRPAFGSCVSSSSSDPMRLRPSRRIVRFAVPALLACGALIAGCAPATDDHGTFDIRELTPGFLLTRAARDPSLAADARGTLALTWVADDSTGADVWLAV